MPRAAVPSLLRGCMVTLLVATPAAAQAGRTGTPVRLSAVLAAFLVDSGVQTRGLPWTTGAALPVRWQSAGPVPNPDASARARGVTHVRVGTFTGMSGDTVRLPMTITLHGTQSGLASVSILIDRMQVTTRGGGYFATREMIEQALRNEGVSLQPLKCSRETEGASYGNLVDAVKVPGKTASGLWWMWQSPQQEPTVLLTLLYRRADMAQVECYSG